MKKFRKTILHYFAILSFVALPVISLSSCGGGGGDDDDIDIEDVQDSSLKPLLGTYTGKITVYPVGGGVQEFYDAEVTLTDAGNSKVKITPKAGQPYSSATPKDVKITTLNAAGVWYGKDSQGTVHYTDESKHLLLITEKTSETDVRFSFDGEKK